ncbi:hypothetical protein PCAR4_60113 [Paraburkholderia caribensis]|nr:hypothetical protein PCAR4_60113 [Paraburkholderia caribensis]
MPVLRECAVAGYIVARKTRAFSAGRDAFRRLRVVDKRWNVRDEMDRRPALLAGLKGKTRYMHQCM